MGLVFLGIIAMYFIRIPHWGLCSFIGHRPLGFLIEFIIMILEINTRKKVKAQSPIKEDKAQSLG